LLVKSPSAWLHLLQSLRCIGAATHHQEGIVDMAHALTSYAGHTFASRMRRITLMLALATLAACGGMMKRPVIDVVDVRVADFTRESAQLTVTLRVQNPNATDIIITDIEAALSIAGTEIGKAESAQPRYVITASSTVMLPVRVGIDIKALPDAMRRGALALISGGVPYQVSGRLTTGNGLTVVPFEKSGQITKMR
jgi:LEA14-like dessication related protein